MKEEARRLTVSFEGDTYQILEELADGTGRNKGQVLRDALYLEKRAQEAWKKKGSVLVEEDGKLREILHR